MAYEQIYYIVINNFRIEPVIIKSKTGSLVTVKFVESEKVIRVPVHRIYESKELAEASISRHDDKERGYLKRGNRPPTLH